MLVAMGGSQWLAEWLKIATCTTTHRKEETRAWVVWAILGPLVVVLVVDDGGGDVEGGVSRG